MYVSWLNFLASVRNNAPVGYTRTSDKSEGGCFKCRSLMLETDAEVHLELKLTKLIWIGRELQQLISE